MQPSIFMLICMRAMRDMRPMRAMRDMRDIMMITLADVHELSPQTAERPFVCTWQSVRTTPEVLEEMQSNESGEGARVPLNRAVASSRNVGPKSVGCVQMVPDEKELEHCSRLWVAAATSPTDTSVPCTCSTAPSQMS